MDLGNTAGGNTGLRAARENKTRAVANIFVI